jgi:serine/threonine protein kinase
MMTMLNDVAALLKKAACPEDVFGDLDADRTVEKEYRRLVRIVHPDLHNNSKQAEEAFKLLGEKHKEAESKIAAGTYGDRSQPINVKIKTKTDEYAVTSRIASGDVCEVYAATNKDGKAVVLKVTRNPINNEITLNEAKQLKWLREESPAKNWKTLIHIPVLIDTFELRQGAVRKRVNVLIRHEGFFTLEEVIKAYPEGLDFRDAIWMYNRLLGALNASHKGGLVHGNIFPQHVMIHPETHNGMLIDWTYSVRRGEVFKYVIPSMKTSYPPDLLAKKSASRGIDLWESANLFIKLLGGKDNFANLDKRIQGPIRACLLGSQHRSRDVWELFSDVNIAVKSVYGSRKFRPFNMPR